MEGWAPVGTIYVSIKDVAIAQFAFRDEDWVERSRRARELAASINGYEVSPRLPGYVSHRLHWVWVETDSAGRNVPWSEFRLLVPTDALIPVALHLANPNA
jgi:hypothetical protein